MPCYQALAVWLGSGELTVFLVVAVILFASSRIPRFARALRDSFGDTELAALLFLALLILVRLYIGLRT